MGSMRKSPPEKPTRESAKIHGWQTQFDGTSENDKSTQVIIGLDFGTAFTKVVINGAEQKYGIPLNDNKQGTDKYLLPTRLYEDSEGNYSVDKPVNCVSSHTDLKIRILEERLDTDTEDRIIAYIAWVLQKSRGWLMTEKQSVFGGSQLKWAVNIGLPTETYTAEKLRETYQKLVGKAWYMSTEPPHGQAGNSKLIYAERTLHPEMIEAFPEFVAQIQGYISSPQRKPGIHTLVDVGAGTIDATVFIVHKEEGENKYPILSESVKQLGTTSLADYRCKKSANNGWRPSPYDVFPSLEEFSRKLGVSKKEIQGEDKTFQGKIIKKQINLIFEKAKDNHDHGYNIVDDTSVNRQERDGIPLMLCGGGAQVKFYQGIVDTLMEKGQGYRQGYLLERTDFPALDKLDAPGLLEKDRHRLSVAYGLSFDALTIGEITRPDPLPIETTGQGKNTCPLCHGAGRYGNCRRCGGSGIL